MEDAARRDGGDARNQHDGSVEVIAEGDLDALLRFERACEGRAHVDEVQTTEAPASGRSPVFSNRITTNMDSLKAKIRSVPDFPKPGITFFDITTLLRDPEGFDATIDAIAKPFGGKQIDLVVGVESRGFILGGAVAAGVTCGFPPVRTKGKLPSHTVRETYDLDYATACLKIHSDAVERRRVGSWMTSGHRRTAATAALVRQLMGTSALASSS